MDLNNVLLFLVGWGVERRTPPLPPPPPHSSSPPMTSLASGSATRTLSCRWTRSSNSLRPTTSGTSSASEAPLLQLPLTPSGRCPLCWWLTSLTAVQLLPFRVAIPSQEEGRAPRRGLRRRLTVMSTHGAAVPSLELGVIIIRVLHLCFDT